LARILASAFIMAGYSGMTTAGPPLAIDDPGILDPGQWEIIAALSMASADVGDVYEAPILDVSYGLSANTQVSASMPYVFANPSDDSSASEFGNLAVGFKWRLYNDERLQIAFAPGYAFGIRVSAAIRGVGDDTDILFLPVNFEYALGNWTVNGEFGYASVKSGTDGWGYGAALGHPLGERTQLMFELYGGADDDFDNDNLNFHIGFDMEMAADWHLLFSAGSGLREPVGSEKLDFDMYLGLQHFR
jgi:hypothetical protein